MTETRQITLEDYPAGMPAPEHFGHRTVDLPDPQDGEVLIRVLWMSVDPYMRGRMRPNVKSYIPPFQKGEPLDGGAVGQVIKSKDPKFAEGDFVVGFAGGWRDHHVGPASAYTKVDPNLAPLSAYLGVLGMPGLTAWVGLSQIIKPKEGEVLYVSGAAGAVGSLACQLGKHYGMTVMGSAGSAEKVEWLEKEAGVDKAFNYKEHDVVSLTKAISEIAPKGVDGYFENVGGMQLEAILNTVAFGGRMAFCGMISGYNNDKPEPGPSNLINIVGRGVMIQGFIVSNYMNLVPQFAAEVAPLLAAGKVKFEETIYEGLDKAPDAFIGLFRGENFGKAVVKIAEPA
ncbi:NADP-dependent oxidoreductase [Parvularcula marina]|uniref:NADP-dependent oxidoreductase n=1 Tax=Parvularcula marina TaxID=2292771 RepID=A0A371R803_9PROT|nr:NADP-dependent oxidoreductase [Parvularcula marina]RFB01580.1 NADP-dependent oxidoreductase [Parvularcula marina]